MLDKYAFLNGNGFGRQVNQNRPAFYPIGFQDKFTNLKTSKEFPESINVRNRHVNNFEDPNRHHSQYDPHTHRDSPFEDVRLIVNTFMTHLQGGLIIGKLTH